MIGLDANILLRVLLDDDAVQSPMARELLAKLTPEQAGYINLVVLMEVVWTIRTRFKGKPDHLHAALETLLSGAAYVVQSRNEVVAALSLAKAGRYGFADALIGYLNQRADCGATWTFDHGAPYEAGFKAAVL
ncbi:type II toxin-antitoxin system VapC family toxin [Bosea sp. AAP35]|uniref:PIN domain-containing protein n=1 Tax=Bosea sp. AAP35 TaxID=1523417 RepID=UPI0009ECA950|nr:type II toxin-antitoxin system VapC family toxin [Bosea sp. AAP35]